MIRKLIGAAILIGCLTPRAFGAQSNFNGVWEIRWCGNVSSHECGGFFLYLVQNGNRICGDHFFATVNVGRLNEGGSRSVVGTIAGNIAQVKIKSGRDNSIFRAQIRHLENKLDWRLGRQIKAGNFDEPLIAEHVILTRAHGAEQYENLKQVIADCGAF